MEFERLAELFRSFAYSQVEETSPLYYHLALAVAEDPDLLRLAAHTRTGQPPANMLLAAVHYLLLGGIDHSLIRYYPSVSPERYDPAHAFPDFRTFCMDNRDSIAELLSTRLVQTNELRRCSYLLPTFNLVAAMAHGQPLVLVEVGASAGLNLLFDRYSYSYNLEGMLVEAGRTASHVVIDSIVHRERSEPLPLGTPAVASRTGLDLNPVDLHDEQAMRWLLALIWPEHSDRFERLKRARQLWLAEPPALIRGDALGLLPDILDTIPPDTAPVIFHTHVLNQFSAASVTELEELLVNWSRRHVLYRIGNDYAGLHRKRYELQLSRYADGESMHSIVAQVDGHGRWFRWFGAG